MSLPLCVCVTGRAVFKDVVVPADIYLPWLAFFLMFGVWALLFFGLKQSPSSPPAAQDSSSASGSGSPSKAKAEPLRRKRL